MLRSSALRELLLSIIQVIQEPRLFAASSGCRQHGGSSKLFIYYPRCNDTKLIDIPTMSSFQPADCTLRSLHHADKTSPLDTRQPITIPQPFDWQVELTRSFQGQRPLERQWRLVAGDMEEGYTGDSESPMRPGMWLMDGRGSAVLCRSSQLMCINVL